MTARCPRRVSSGRVAAALAVVAMALVVVRHAGAGGGVDPNSGIDFVRITHPNNAPWMGSNPPTPGDRAVGRGSVGYEYHIGKFEVTTAQWVEFFNAAYDRPRADWLPHVFPPDHWGAQATTPNTSGGQRWRVVPGREMWAVGNISWRMGAMYCNWLHNNKSTDRAAFLIGAYDVSTFGPTPGFPGIFNDQLAHHPGARYWIPTWDEWLKAAHYDPNKDNGDGTSGGWWRYSTTSDTAPISNPPPGWANGANGQVNAAWTQQYVGVVDPFSIPLGAYAGVTSPWGLYDVAGATSEWTEEVITEPGGVRYRQYNGSWWVDGPVLADLIGVWSAESPNVSTFDYGLRIASAIPGPGGVAGAGVAFIALCSRARRRYPCDSEVTKGPLPH